MRRSAIAAFLAAVALALVAPSAFAYNPPAGASLVPVLGAGESDIAGLTVTALDSPWADRLNPAASAAQQRTVLALGLMGLSDFGTEGFGMAAALGASFPKPWGVIGAGLRLVSTPGTMTDLPLGTFVTASGSLSKVLFPNFYVGAGLDLAMGGASIAGGASGFGWGLGLDLGFLHFPGDLGFLKDFRWGGALTGIGKGYNYATPGTYTSFPQAFTPTFGAEALLVKSADWKVGIASQLSFPSFQDLALSLQAGVSWRDIVSLRTSWGFDLVELLHASKRSLVPSLVIAGRIPLERKDASLKGGWDKGELDLAASVLPLVGPVNGYGLSGALSLGVVDRNPPSIKLSFPATEWGPAWISPNADGVKDSLVLPVEIKDERYIESFALVVRKGDLASEADGPVIRTIANKEARPEDVTFATIWKRLLYVQTGLPVPPALTWDGRADSGEVAPDGTYSVFVEATDDNGNRGLAGPFKVVVDTVAPQATVTPVEPSLIFSPDGDGNKDTISFRITGSVEDLWKLRVLDAGGNAMRALEYRGAAPADFTWDGRTDADAVAPDGVYSLVLSSTDRAGNATQVRIDNIVVNTQQPPINIAIDKAAFSPNGDGRLDTVAFTTSVPVKSGLVAWRLAVVDRNKIERWAISGQDGAKIPARVDWDGRDSSGAALPEGQYQAALSAWYSNGHSPKAYSPLFTIDLSSPAGTAAEDRQAFNPAGAEGQNRITFTLAGSQEEAWTAEILPVPASGQQPAPGQAAIRTWTMGARPEPSLEWDGTDDVGRDVPDGSYVFRLSSRDRAGNAFASPLLPILVDTQKKAARLSADQRAFSPNGDGQKDSVKLAASVLAKDKLTSFVLTVEPADAPGGAVRTWKGSQALADSYAWDGLDAAGGKVPDGRYIAKLKVAWQNGDTAEAQTPAIVVDTQAPSVSASAQPLLFSPNGDGRLDSTRISQSSTAEDLWSASIKGADGTAVRSFSWKGQAPSFDWDGTDEAGNVVKDGTYSYEVSAADAAGNSGKAQVTGIVVDTRPVQAFITASETGISPNGDGFRDFVSFAPIVSLKEGIDTWRLVIAGKDGAEVRAFQGTKEVPARQDWDGRDSKGQVVQGEFTATLTVDYLKGDRAVAKSTPVLVDNSGARAAIQVTPDLFSPDNDGVNDELTFAIAVEDASPIVEWRLDINEAAVVEGSGSKPSERLFISWGGKGTPAPSIVWDGRSARGELVEAATDYPWYFTVKDALGNVTKLSGKVSVDVLVMKEGDRLKIKVPSIVFRPNYADFVGLDTSTVDNNAKVIKRIAQILNRFKGYRIQIEGHANSVAKISGAGAQAVADEETKELVPLSLGRADLVRELLVKEGVDSGRLSSVGLGSSEPVVDFKDAVNRWKNRRVEFVLIKN